MHARRAIRGSQRQSEAIRGNQHTFFLRFDLRSRSNETSRGSFSNGCSLPVQLVTAKGALKQLKTILRVAGSVTTAWREVVGPVGKRGRRGEHMHARTGAARGGRTVLVAKLGTLARHGAWEAFAVLAALDDARALTGEGVGRRGEHLERQCLRFGRLRRRGRGAPFPPFPSGNQWQSVAISGALVHAIRGRTPFPPCPRGRASGCWPCGPRD